MNHRSTDLGRGGPHTVRKSVELAMPTPGDLYTVHGADTDLKVGVGLP
jgi:hypothetical protein